VLVLALLLGELEWALVRARDRGLGGRCSLYVRAR
jgi:hypothetical protein